MKTNLLHRIRFGTILCVVIFFLVSMPASGATITKTITFSGLKSKVTSVNGVNYRFYTLNDYEYVGRAEDEGKPIVPCKSMRFALPWNATNITIEATPTKILRSNTTYSLLYSPKFLTLNDSVPYVYTHEDASIYQANLPYPSNYAEMIDDSFLYGGNRVVTVVAYPFLYMPAEKRIYRASSLKITITYDLSDNAGNDIGRICLRRDGALRYAEQQMVKKLVENPNDVAAYSLQSTTPQQDSDIPFYEYTVLTHHGLEPAYKRLIALKRQKGYKAGIVCFEDIYDSSDYLGDSVYVSGGTIMNDLVKTFQTDTVAKVRSYLRQAYVEGLRYCVIGSDSIYKSCHVNGEELRNRFVSSDAYLSCLTDEYKYDSIGWNAYQIKPSYSQIHFTLPIGRIQTRDNQAIQNFTDKLLHYELNPGHGDRSYLSRALIVSANDTKASFGTSFKNKIETIFDSIRHYIDYVDYPSGTEVINDMKEVKYALSFWTGHGCPTGVAVNNTQYPPIGIISANGQHGWHPVEAGNGLDMLEGCKYYPSIMLPLSCSTAPLCKFTFDYPFNMAQSFTLGKDYGGPVFFGNAIDTFAIYLSEYANEMADALLADENHVGDALIAAKNNTILNSIRPQASFGLFGDPELSIWTAEPQTFNNVEVRRNDHSIDVELGSVTDSCYVAFSKDSDVQERHKVASGNYTFAISPNSTVMVYKQNYLPWIAPLLLQNERFTDRQYVIASTVEAGGAVDSHRSAGEYVIADGACYEIEAMGTVNLQPGFKVEKGGYFKVTHGDF